MAKYKESNLLDIFGNDVLEVERIKEDTKKVKRKKLFKKDYFWLDDVFTYGIDEAYKYYKKDKLKKMCEKLPSEDIILDNVKRFIYSSNTKDKGNFSSILDYMEMLINMLKFNYENDGANFIPDSVYDKMIIRFNTFREEPVEAQIVARAEAVTDHEFALLKGTLDKCHYVDGNKDGVRIPLQYNDSIEKFIDTCFEALVEQHRVGEKLTFLLSLKYDGTSAVFTISEEGRVVSVITRGKNDKGVDITHLFKKLRFKTDGIRLGLQTEIMMTNKNIKNYSKDKDMDYSNSRSAVTSVLTSLNGKEYSKYLSPVPLKAVTAISKDEYEYESPYLLNTYMKDQDIMFICKEIEGSDKDELITEIVKYIQSVIAMRGGLEFQIDGVVIECMNENIRDALGRSGNKNKFQIAYKFPSMEQVTELLDVTISVGRTGKVVPKAIYKPLPFNGTMQTKATLSSRDRMDKLHLAKGDLCNIVYSNDVIPYFDCVVERRGGEPLRFPKLCPACGEVLYEEGADSYCYNKNCPPKLIATYANFIKVLKFRNLSKSFIDTLIENGFITGFVSILKPNPAIVNIDGIGYKTYDNYVNHCNKIINDGIGEEILAEALGLSGAKTCEAILSEIHLDELMDNPERLFMIAIPGVEEKKKIKFLDRLNKLNETGEVDRLVKMLKIEKCKTNAYDMKVCFSGFRDKALKEKLEADNIYVSDNLKGVEYLIIPFYGFTSSKKTEADKRDITVMDKDDFIKMIGI